MLQYSMTLESNNGLPKKEKTLKKITRRDFLIMVSLLLLGLLRGDKIETINEYFKDLDLEDKEVLLPPLGAVSIVDFAGELRNDQGVEMQTEPYSKQEVLGRIDKTGELSKVISGLLIGQKDWKSISTLLDSKLKQAVAIGAFLSVREHGKSIVSIARQVSSMLNSQVAGSANLIPLENVLPESSEDIPVTQDELGNIIVDLKLNIPKLIKMVRKCSQKQRILNFSFVVPGVGVKVVKREFALASKDLFYSDYAEDESGVRYYFSIKRNRIAEVLQDTPYTQKLLTENGERYLLFIDYYSRETILKILVNFPLYQNADEAEKENYNNNYQNCKTVELEESRTEVIEPYTGKNAVENFKILIDICKAFPDKLIVAASGNTNIDFMKIRSQIGEFPTNLIIVGEVLHEGTTIQVKGADIYLDPADFGIKANGSSTATVIVSTIADKIARHNLTFSPEEIKIEIQKLLRTQDFKFHHTSEGSICYPKAQSHQENLSVMFLDRESAMQSTISVQNE